MRGGVARWKRGVAGHGLRAATAYALGGVCDTSGAHLTAAQGIEQASSYAHEQVTRFTVNSNHGVSEDVLDRAQLRAWIDGHDPLTGDKRGRTVHSANADLLFDATVNTPKSLSLAAMLDDELAAGLTALQDRIRDRALALWQQELNARRGQGGLERMDLAQIEVVELRHERSRALDPHAHRHLWLNAKVLGMDGQWSNVDSRVLLRFQTILNAEGDLAVATDPEWRKLLAAKGLTVDAATGEIDQLAHLTAPLSRRGQQIETARAMKLEEWQEQHPGQTPTKVDLQKIDHWAWSYGRPNKPKNFDETVWRDTVLAEIHDLDPLVAKQFATPQSKTTPAEVDAPTIAELDRDWLARAAIVAADDRSTSASGRMSLWDIRACATRAVAATGVMADRDTLNELIEDVTDRAMRDYTQAVLDDPKAPDHIRRFVATETLAAKVELDAQLGRLSARVPAVDIVDRDVDAVAETVTEHGLDDFQRAAAAAIAGTGDIVTVEGPAGAGKTTMLTVARHLLAAQNRQMLLVAPTKKAALVAGRETGAPATSVHGLLHEYGWRWHEDEFGKTVWTKLAPGDTDPNTGTPWTPRKLSIGPTTRIIVDEAGMVDLDTARALATVCEETGASVAFVGDPQQVLPVGHAGAMRMAQRHAARDIELVAIHRFRTEQGEADTAWAELSRRLRSPENLEEARLIANELVARDRVRIASSTAEANKQMVNAWLEAHGDGQSMALVVSTNEEARTINDAIQQQRVQLGQLDASQSVLGRDGQTLLVGDTVQTRRNDSGTGVENRATWRVRRIDHTGIELESTGPDAVRRSVPTEYVREHVQLAYATTAHGIQGETVQRSLVGPGVDAAGLYVGLTRGKRCNEAIVIAGNEEAAINELVEQMHRNQQELDLEDARRAAVSELSRAAIKQNGRRVQPWQQRPYGHLIQLDAAIQKTRARLPHSVAEIQAQQDRIDAARMQLTQLERAELRKRTSSDLADRSEPVSSNPDADALRARISDLNATLATMRHENKPVMDALDKLQQEKNLRNLALPAEQRDQEAHERAAHARNAATAAQARGPVSDPHAPHTPTASPSRGPDFTR